VREHGACKCNLKVTHMNYFTVGKIYVIVMHHLSFCFHITAKSLILDSVLSCAACDNVVMISYCVLKFNNLCLS